MIEKGNEKIVSTSLFCQGQNVIGDRVDSL